MSLENVHVEKGEIVRLTQNATLSRAGNYRSDSQPFDEGREFVVTRVDSYWLTVRTLEKEYDSYSGRTQYKSFSCQRQYLALTVNDPDRPMPRKLGTKPEDTDEMTYIGTDHPGIQWLWDDLAAYAKGQNWCGTYDTLAEHVGIPGRKRPFTATTTINGITLTASIEARSQDDADQILAATVASNQTPSAQG